MTPGAHRVLAELAADDTCDLVQEGGAVYCGTRRTSSRVVHELLWHLAISVEYREANFTRYSINSTGRAIARRPELADEVIGELLRRRANPRRRPFVIVGDRIRPMPSHVRAR